MHILIRRERVGTQNVLCARAWTYLYVHQHSGRDAIAEHALRKRSCLDGALSDRDENNLFHRSEIDCLIRQKSVSPSSRIAFQAPHSYRSLHIRLGNGQQSPSRVRRRELVKVLDLHILSYQIIARSSNASATVA